MRVEVPEWRIVPEELWNRVETQIHRVNKRFGAVSVGGHGRMGRGPKYLFSGFMICGLCGARMIIVSGDGKRAYVKYGCPSHRYRGVCTNSVLIRRDRLEVQLLHGLSSRTLNPVAVAFALERFQEALQRRLNELRDQADSAANGVAALQAKRQELKTQVNNVTDAIAAIGHSPNLLSKLATIEAEIGRLDDRLAEMNQPRELSLDELREFLCNQAAEIGRLLHGDVEIARQTMAKHIEHLMLTPTEAPDGPLLEVSGDVELFNVLGDPEEVCSSNGGQRRDRSPASLMESVTYRF